MIIPPKDQRLQSKKDQSVAQTLLPPGKYEVTPDQTFEVSIYIREFKGRWVVSDRPTASTVEHKVVFRVWNFDEMIELRRKATSYDPSRRSNIVDNDLLNRLKIQKLLVSWTFADENPRLQIHHVGGILTDESWNAFRKLSPCIAERIIEEMNLVLENGG